MATHEFFLGDHNGRGPPAGQFQRRDTDPSRWATTRCCVRALAGINVRRSGESGDAFLTAAEAAELALPRDRLTGDGAGVAENNR